MQKLFTRFTWEFMTSDVVESKSTLSLTGSLERILKEFGDTPQILHRIKLGVLLCFIEEVWSIL